MARAKYAEWLTEQGLERLAEMAPRLTDAEMAKEMGISPSDVLRLAQEAFGDVGGGDARTHGRGRAREQ